MSQIFFDAPAPHPRVRKLMDAAHDELGSAFGSRLAMETFFTYVLTPRSNRWAFFSSGKTGTTSAIAMLFELEFGVPLTARADNDTDMNRDAALHRTLDAHVFRPLHQRGDIDSMQGYLRNTLCIATVRHPTDRAWSAFRYLCRSQELAHPQFSSERIRLCAATGFDWSRDAGTEDGFLRFLDYVALGLAQEDVRRVNNHWRPQVADVRPDLFPIAILGRAEDMGGFAAALHQALGTPGRPLRAPRLNSADGAPASRPDWMARPAVRQRLEQIYAADYAAFGYAP